MDSLRPKRIRHPQHPARALAASALLASATAAAIPAALRAAPGPSDRPYIFSNAASDGFNTYSGPSINNHGTVAFVSGFHPSDSLLRISGPSGTSTTVLNATGAYNGFGFSPDINDSGQIAIEAGLAGTSDSAIIRTRVGGPTVHIAETNIQGLPGTFDFFYGNPTINAHGQVAFVGLRGDNVEGIFVGNGSGPATPLASDLNGLYDFGEEAHLSNDGVAAFTATNSSNVRGVFTAGPGGIGTVALAGAGVFNFSEPSINNAGTVIFAARGNTNRIYTAPAGGGPLTIVASEGAGFNDFWNFELPLINDNGDVAFFAELGNFRTGLFDGPDPARDRIIMTGDTLFGSTLHEIYFQLPPMFKALNNHGQVAFSYRLANGQHGIAIATPALFGDANADGQVNLSDFNLLAANFGQTGRNWTTGDFTGDGLVNLADFNLLAGNFGISAAGPHVTPEDWSALAAAVPEPACLAAPGVSVLACLWRRQRPRRT